MPTFVPALSLSEAEVRISGLVGGILTDTRGPKRTLRALADALGLDAPVQATNGTVGGEIADALGVPWPGAAATGSDQITLVGLNILLEAASDYFTTHAFPKPQALPAQFAGPSWSWFIPARSKIEAVNRISLLTGSGPEVLGPGGKERKSVFANLATRAGLGVSPLLSKVSLGDALATALGVTWTPACGSTGETITLEGLNVVLAGAERRLRGTAPTAPDPLHESGLILSLLAAEFSDGPWDGTKAIVEMRDDGHNQWRQMEWPGFYFEYRGLRALYGGMGRRTWTHPPQKYGVTTFDYAHQFVWDMKAHSATVRAEPSGRVKRGRTTAPLNDKASTDACAADTGLGLVVMNGQAFVDETGAFDAWQKSAVAVATASRSHAPSKFSRSRKKAFHPTMIELYRWDDLNVVNAAVAAGALQVMAQGKQASGAPRPPKYTLRMASASNWLVGSVALGTP